MSSKHANATDEIVGQRIKALRLRSGLSQMELADKLGITFQQVQKYEKGVNRVGAGRLFEIAGLLHVGICDLFPKSISAQSAEILDSARDGAEISSLLTSVETLRLVQSFAKINDLKKRRRIVALVQEIAEAETAPQDMAASSIDTA
jgi:transcriptional regulator with XRE-family HTH domain